MNRPSFLSKDVNSSTAKLELAYSDQAPGLCSFCGWFLVSFALCTVLMIRCLQASTACG